MAKIPVVKAPSALTVLTRKEVKDALFAEAVTSADCVILDCAAVEEADTSGLGALVDVARRLGHEGGHLLLDHVPDVLFDMLSGFSYLDRVMFIRRADSDTDS